jgi:uncharacterized protein (TIGR02246 family)
MRNLILIASLFSVGAGSSAFADPAQECSAAAEKWGTAYSSNNVDAIIQNYTKDAILHGTSSPTINVGEADLRKYFARSPGSGNKVKIGEHQSRTLDDKNAFVAGFYGFTVMREGKPTPSPARFSMVCVLADGQWRIAHHHSSALPAAR